MKKISLSCFAVLVIAVSAALAKPQVDKEEFFSQTNSDEQQHQINSTSKPRTSGRSGRMLDLDHLSGDIGKEQKLAKEKSVSGARQSRLLNAEAPMKQLEPRSNKKSSGGKMSIKGFIPIVSLEGASKGAKHGFEGLGGDEEEEQESQPEQHNSAEEQRFQQQQPQAANNLREQMISNFGSQTSLGHASFAPQATEWQQQVAPQSSQIRTEQANMGERANRKLLGSSGLLSGLTQKRFVSNLVPNYNQQQLAIQGPTNAPFGAEECMCVPFFQCKNGFLSEAQLSRSQLQQMSMAAFQPAQLNQANLQQSPRSLPAQSQVNTNDLHSISQQPQISSLMSQIQQQQPQQQQQQQAALLRPQSNEQQQMMVNDIYEQLRKSIESANLEQQLNQQQANNFQLDERSKAGSASSSSNSTEPPTEDPELLERSFLKPLARRQSFGAASKCGLMRTCCRIPPHLISAAGQQHFRPQQAGRLNNGEFGPHQLPPQPQYQLLHPAMSANHLQAHQSQLQPQLAADFVQAQLGASSQLAPSELYQPAPNSLVPATNNLGQQQQQHSGGFMAGRCGTRQTLGIAGRVQNAAQPGSESQADFGEFPAHAAILKRISPGDSLFVCSAVLLSGQWLATAAHCVARKHRPEELKVRLGEWDVNRDDEFYPHLEANVREIVVHPDYQASSLINDIALIRLDRSVDQHEMPHITPACLASPSDELMGGAASHQRCWLAGWGKDAFGQAGAFQSVLRKVDLPLVGRGECENALRFHTKLGRFFRLHPSVLCAGGERGKDACEGDGGAGLYCTDPESGLTRVAGLVSWGVGCGQRGVPGMYTNLAHFNHWIENVVAASGEEGLYDRGVGVSEQAFKSLVSERSNAPSAANLNATLSAELNSSNATTLAPSSALQQNQTADNDENKDLESRAG